MFLVHLGHSAFQPYQTKQQTTHFPQAVGAEKHDDPHTCVIIQRCGVFRLCEFGSRQRHCCFDTHHAFSGYAVCGKGSTTSLQADNSITASKQASCRSIVIKFLSIIYVQLRRRSFLVRCAFVYILMRIMKMFITV